MTVSDPLIVAEQLTKRFGSVTALDGLDLTIGAGEVFGYLGPNGAGKTTTLRLLVDALRPTTGRVIVLGSDPSEPATRARIGYLPAELHLDPRYTANDVLSFFGALRGGLDTVRAEQLCARFSLDPTRPAGQLSTGNRRKIGVVQAFVHRPQLLLLDEPTSGLDPLLQHEFHELVAEAVAGGATVFLSSHVLSEVEQLADRVGILRRGVLVDIATLDELRGRARQRLQLHVDGDTSLAPQAFQNVAGVVSVTVTGDVIDLVVQGSVDAALKAAATLTVRRIVTIDSDLEDSFLAYYHDDQPAMIIAARFERDRRVANLAWAAGIVAVVVLTAALWPSIEGSASFDDVIDDLPDTVKALVGAQGGISLGSPAGYLNARIFATLLPVLLTVYGISIGARALAGSEQDGTLELILANPVSRVRVATERAVSVVAFLAALGAVALLALLLCGTAVGMLDEVSLPRLAGACCGVTVLAALHATIAFAAGAATGHHGSAVAVAATVAVAGYLLAGLLTTTDSLNWLQALSPWNWLLDRNVLVNGTPPVPLIVEFALSATLVALGVHRFNRRDLR